MNKITIFAIAIAAFLILAGFTAMTLKEAAFQASRKVEAENEDENDPRDGTYR